METFLQTKLEKCLKKNYYSELVDAGLGLVSLEETLVRSFTARTWSTRVDPFVSASTRFIDKRPEDNWAIASDELSTFETSSFEMSSMEVELETFSLEVELTGLNPATPFQFWMLERRSRLIRRRRFGSFRRYCQTKQKKYFFVKIS